MGARVSLLVDALIDAKVQNQVEEQKSLLLRLDKATQSVENRHIFVEERGLKICCELVTSTNFDVATYAIRVVGNVARSVEYVPKITADMSFGDVIIQLKVYPPAFCYDALNTIALIAITESTQKSLLELGLFAPLVKLIEDEDTTMKLKACDVFVKLCENLAVARIIVSRDTLDTFIQLTNHVDNRMKRSAIAVLANLCKAEDLKALLVKRGVILQFFLLYEECSDTAVRREAMRGAKCFFDIFTSPGNLRLLKPDDIKSVSYQLQMKFPAVLGKKTMEFDFKVMNRMSIASVLNEVQNIIAISLDVERAVLWIHDPKEQVLWTFNPKVHQDMEKDVTEEALIKLSDRKGIVADVFQGGKKETFNNLSIESRHDHHYDRECDFVSLNSLIQVIIDNRTKEYIGCLQILNKVTSVRPTTTEEDDTDKQVSFNGIEQEKPVEKEGDKEIFTSNDYKLVDTCCKRIAPLIPSVVNKHRILLRNQKLLLLKDKSENPLIVDISALANCDVRTVIKTFMASARVAVNCHKSTFYLHSPQQGLLWGVLEDGVTDFKISVNQGIAGRVARDGKLQVIRDCYIHPDFDRSMDDKTGFRTKDMLCAPIKSFRGATSDEVGGRRGATSKVIGVLQLINKKTGNFNKNDIQRIEDLRSLMITVLDSKMKELEIELNERRSSSTDAITILIRAIQDPNWEVGLEAIQAMSRVCASELNHTSIIQRGGVEVLVGAAIHKNIIKAVIDSAIEIVTPRAPTLIVESEEIIRRTALAALATMAANEKVRQSLVERGCLQLFMSFCTAPIFSNRYEAAKGLANLASAHGAHEPLCAPSFLQMLETMINPEEPDMMIQVSRLIAQLSSFRHNLDHLYNYGAWDIIWRILFTIFPGNEKSVPLRDSFVFAVEASALLCGQAEIRSQYLNEMTMRKQLDKFWDLNDDRIQCQVLRHFVYILEDKSTHTLFFETGGLDWFDKAIDQYHKSGPKFQKLVIASSEAWVELAKNDNSVLPLLEWGILSHMKRFSEINHIDLLYFLARLCQLIAREDSFRARMIDMRFGKVIGVFLRHINEEIRLEGLEAVRRITKKSEIAVNQKKYITTLDTIAGDILDDLIPLITYPTIDAPNLKTALPAFKVLEIMCQNVSARIRIIQAKDMINNLVYIIDEDREQPALPAYKDAARELLLVVNDGSLEGVDAQAQAKKV